MNKVERFYYQPSFFSSVISWSWTLLIPIVGIIFWLEVTHFNWITAGFLVAFVIVVIIQVLSRTIEVFDDELVMNRTLSRGRNAISLSEIKGVTKTMFGLKFSFKNKEFNYFLSRKSRDRLYNILKGE